MVKKHVDIENKLILDVGCGLGDYDHQFHIDGAKDVIGLDINIPGISIGHSRNKNIHYIIGDAQNIPLRSSTVDMVFSHEVLEHVPDDVRTLSESSQVLKDEGYLALFVPNKLYPFEIHWGPGPLNVFPLLSWAPITIRKLVSKLFKKKYTSLYTRSKLKKMLSPNFNIIKIGEVFPRFKGLRKKKLNKIIGFLELLSETPLKRFGVSIYIIAKKAT